MVTLRSALVLPAAALILLLVVPGPARSASGLRGTYTHKLSLPDFGRAENPYTICPCVWTMRIGPKTLVLEARGQGNPTELLTIAGSKLTVKDKPGSLARICATEATGVYTWRLRKGRLDLAVVKDSCGDRAAVLGHPGWRRR